MTLVEVSSEAAIVALCDPSVALPAGLDQDALLRELEAMARSRAVFCFVEDDPVRYRLSVRVGDEASPAGDDDFEPAGGSFGLDVPSGRIAIRGWTREGAPVTAGEVECPPGSHVLAIRARRPFDGSRHGAAMTALLGAADWAFVQRVDRLAMVGCLPVALTAGALMMAKWRWLIVLLPLAALSWLPHVVLRRSQRYRAAERRMAEGVQARPHFIVDVTPSAGEGLAGGFLRA